MSQFTGGNTQSSHTFTSLTPGNYRVDVKGVYACIETTGPFIIPARIPVVVAETLTQIECFGQKTGSIILNVSGGNPPLSYLWTTGNTSQNLTNVGVGEYTVVITDAYGCETIRTYTITGPPEFVATLSKVDDPGNNGDGSASVSVTGGTPGYSYLWSKTGDPGFVFQPSATASEVTGLGYGEYTVTVTDTDGCVVQAKVFIFEKEICDDGIDNNGNGLAD